MKYVTYLDHDATARVGIIDDDLVIPLEGVASVSVGTDALASAVPDRTKAQLFQATRLLPSSHEPERIICVGLNYYEHIAETRRATPEYPVLFPKFRSSLLAADEDIVLPEESSQVDWEGELAVIIGRKARRVKEENALDFVLGYSTANDITMRDFQYKTHQWLQGKAWDRSTPLGPVVVTPDELDITTGAIRTYLNGNVVQESDLSKLIFTVPRLIADISTFTTLMPGDIILTGTPGGVGYRREPQVFLKDGDIVEVQIEGIGAVHNRVAAEAA